MAKSMRQLFAEMDDCAVAPLSLDRLGRLHRWGFGPDYHSGKLERPPQLSLAELWRRHGQTLKFLWFDTYLMPETKLSGAVSQVLNPEAPDRMARAHEIGAMAKSEGYDVVALCEVWTDDSRDAILNNWAQWPKWIRGPGKSTVEISVQSGDPLSVTLGALGVDTSVTVLTIQRPGSGLLSVLPGKFPLLADAREQYADGGVPYRDSDYWANKGILQVVLETGHNSKLELYTTHLISGNDLVKEDGDRETVVKDVAKAQIDQLASFVNQRHSPPNVIVVAGDFNVSDSGPMAGYLSQRMEQDLQLEDVWTRFSAARYFADRSGTSSDASFPDDPIRSKYICDMTSLCGNFGDSDRIDHVFIQKPVAEHDIVVNMSRPRRRHFKRTPPAAGIPTLSDHVGVEFRLFVADRHKPAHPAPA